MKQLLIDIRIMCGFEIKASILRGVVVIFHKSHAVRACFEGSAGGDFISTFNRQSFRGSSRGAALNAEFFRQPRPDFGHVETHAPFSQFVMRATLCNEVVHAADGHLNHARHVSFRAVVRRSRQLRVTRGSVGC